jgi:hypothetical protein
MRSDGPTVPHLGGYEPGAAPEPEFSHETPTWPPVGNGTGGAHGPNGFPIGTTRATVLKVSLGANVALLVGLLGFFLLSHAGVFALAGSTGPSIPGAALSSSTALPSPTATSNATATGSPGLSSGWLQVTPNSVQLGCDGDQRTQVIVLANTGPQHVQWQANLPGAGDNPGVAFDPHEGDLEAGATVSIQIQNTTSSSGSHGNFSRHGVITFATDESDAGPPASLSYSLARCR